ncbi:MAG: hypothetical protein AB2L07_15880 [Thermoanaerobaculaceae bacterium]
MTAVRLDALELALPLALQLTSFGAHLNLYSNAAAWRTLDAGPLFATFLPGVECRAPRDVPPQGHAVLIHRAVGPRRIRWAAECTRVWDPFRKVPAYMYVLIEQIIERVRQRLGVYTLHASSISLDGKGVVFLADNWHGKTSTALYLALCGPSRVVANNRTLLQGTQIVGGSQLFDVKESFWQYNPELVERLGSVVAGVGTDRQSFSWPELCISDFPVPLAAIVLPHINAGAHETQRISRQDAVWYLFRQASFLVRGDGVLFGGRVASPSYDDDALAQARLEWINSLVRQVPLVYVSGSLAYIQTEVQATLRG